MTLPPLFCLEASNYEVPLATTVDRTRPELPQVFQYLNLLGVSVAFLVGISDITLPLDEVCGEEIRLRTFGLDERKMCTALMYHYDK